MVFVVKLASYRLQLVSTNYRARVIWRDGRLNVHTLAGSGLKPFGRILRSITARNFGGYLGADYSEARGS